MNSEPPNTLTSPVSLGHPGTLPKFNKEMVNHAVKLGLALDCDITREMHFDRKIISTQIYLRDIK